MKQESFAFRRGRFKKAGNKDFSSELLGSLLKCAGEWRSYPLEVRLVMDWAKALYREDAGSAAAALCSGLEELRKLELLQLSISKLWGALACGCTSWVQEIAEAIDQQGLAGTLPGGSPFFPVHFIGPEGERRVVASGCARRRFGELPDLDVLGAYDGGFDVSYLSRPAYDALCKYLQGSELPTSLPLLPELFALAHRWNAKQLREALVKRYRMPGGFDLASWGESLRVTAAILPMVDGDDRINIAHHCVESLPGGAIALGPGNFHCIIAELEKLPQSTVDALMAMCAVGSQITPITVGMLRRALLFYVTKQFSLEAFEASARGTGFIHLLPFMEQCLLTGDRGLEDLLFAHGPLWEFFAAPREQFEPAVRSLLLAANAAFVREGRGVEMLFAKMRRYFTAEAVRVLGEHPSPSLPEADSDVTTTVQELCVGLEKNCLPPWLGRHFVTQPTEAEAAAMELLKQVLSSSDFKQPLGYLRVKKGRSSAEYSAIMMEALPRIADATGHVGVIIQLLRFYAAAVNDGLDVKEFLWTAYRELHDLLPPTRWYEVDSWYPHVNYWRPPH